MDDLMCASLSHTRHWYEVRMLKVPAIVDGLDCRETRVRLEDCCSCFWNLGGSLEYSKAEQRFEGRRVTCQKKRAGGTTSAESAIIGRSPVPETHRSNERQESARSTGSERRGASVEKWT